MRAAIVEAFGPVEAIAVKEVPTPQPGPGEVRIAVKAAGVGFVDALVAEGRYQVKPPLPFAPGGEFAGVVDALGEGVTGLKAGDRVIGGGFTGGFAEYAVIHAMGALPIPDSMSFAQAAVFRTNFATAIHALKDRAALQPGETVLVLGAGGGTGTAAVTVAKIMGARVIGAASSAEKRAAAVAAGADETVDSSAADWREALERAASAIEAEDLAANRRMGVLGAALIAPGSGVLTHCNTGSLATAGFGTALGVIRAGVAQDRIA